MTISSTRQPPLSAGAELARVAHAASARDVALAVVEAGVADSCAAGWATLNPVTSQWREERGGALDRVGRPLDRTLAAEDAFFDLASITKPMMAVALAKSGIDRARPLREMLSEAQGAVAGEATLERLLSHRAGLEANLPLFQKLREDNSPLAQSEVLRWASDARRGDCTGELPSEGFAPLYSDLGYVLAGEAIARALEAEDAGAVVRDLVIEPLGLRLALGTARDLARAGIDVAPCAAPTEIVEWRGGAVRGAVHDENAWMLTGLGGSGHAGIFGTIGGLLAFGKHVLQRMEELRWTWEPRSGGTLRAGFDGKSLAGSSAGERAGPRTIGHLGFTGTSLWIDPDARVVVALLTNRVFPTRDDSTIRAARPLAHDALTRIALRGNGA